MSDGETVIVEGKVITTEDRDKTRSDVVNAVQMVEMSYMRLGGLLYRVKHGQYFVDWGYESFEEYVETELSFKSRKAAYHINIWNRLFLELGVKEAQLEGIGWSKSAALTRVVDAENLTLWLSLARELSFRDLSERIDAALKAAKEEEFEPEEGPEGEESEETPGVGEGVIQQTEPFLVRVYPEQKGNIERVMDAARETASSDKAGHLFECICLDYLARQDGASKLPDDLQWWTGEMKQRFPKDHVLVFKDGDDLRDKLQAMLDNLND